MKIFAKTSAAVAAFFAAFVLHAHTAIDFIPSSSAVYGHINTKQLIAHPVFKQLVAPELNKQLAKEKLNISVFSGSVAFAYTLSPKSTDEFRADLIFTLSRPAAANIVKRVIAKNKSNKNFRRLKFGKMIGVGFKKEWRMFAYDSRTLIFQVAKGQSVPFIMPRPIAFSPLKKFAENTVFVTANMPVLLTLFQGSIGENANQYLADVRTPAFFANITKDNGISFSLVMEYATAQICTETAKRLTVMRDESVRNYPQFAALLQKINISVTNNNVLTVHAALSGDELNALVMTAKSIIELNAAQQLPQAN